MVPSEAHAQGGQSGELESGLVQSSKPNPRRRWVKLQASHIPSLARTASRERPPWRCAAATRRCLIVSDLRRCAVSRSEAISRHNSIGTITAVGSPASLETIWMSVSGTTSVYPRRRATHHGSLMVARNFVFIPLSKFFSADTDLSSISSTSIDRAAVITSSGSRYAPDRIARSITRNCSGFRSMTTP